MRGLSIDPNTKQTGLVWWEEDEPGSWRTLKVENAENSEHWHDDRFMTNLLCGKLRIGGPWKLDWLAIEDVYVGPNFGKALELARIVYGVCAVADLYEVPCYLLSTLAIDQSLGISYPSGQRKQATQKFAEMNNMHFDDEHQCDAYCAGRAALGLIKVEGWEKAGT